MEIDPINVLLIEDNLGDFDLINDMLSDWPAFKLIFADRLSSGIVCLQRKTVALILLDLSLPDSQGLTTFSKLYHKVPHIPIVVLTGTSDEELGLSAVKAGAQDYLIKGRTNAQLLSRTMHYAIERKKFEKALDESEERLRLVVESVREVIFHIDLNGLFTVLNAAWTKLLGFSVSQSLGNRLIDYVAEEHRAHCLERIDFLLHNRNENARFELCFLQVNAERLWMEMDISISVDHDLEIIGIAGVLNNISERKINEERLLYVATHDGLTGLPNRNLFEDRLKHAMAQAIRMHCLVAVVFIDLDQFKMVNDSMGHDQGDILLRIVAQKLLDTVRAGDTVARLGGDEFVIVLSELETENDAILIADKIMQSFEQPVSLNNQDLYVGGSIGISMYPKDGETVTELVKNADTAMYRSKDRGRKQICFYSPEMNAKLMGRLTLEYDLRRAIERDEFQVYYQPKVSLTSGRILGFEALLRWQHPTRGMVFPDEIIPIAESSGSILDIGRWILRAACMQTVEWQKLGYTKLSMAVNLSARQFWESDLEINIATILRETTLRSSCLELEITESSVMRNPEDTISTLTRLNEMGITLSVDDFGTGYSSLSYLKRFPIHALKIDQSFVKDITDDADAAAITKAIIALAHTMNLHVIAEGVQTDSQRALLKLWECDSMQGFFFSKPLSGADAETLLRQQYIV